MGKSVSYPIAKTPDGQWVHIDNASHGHSYHCPECESPFVARLGAMKIHHFAHKPNYVNACTGESAYHSLAKHLLAYHYEKEGQIPLVSKCTTCDRNFSGKKKIIRVEVEKGHNEYRPDVCLFLEDDVVVDCEIVYKNPLGEKLTSHKERKSYLLIWFIKGQENEVPPLIQYGWSRHEYRLEQRKKSGGLLLLGYSPPPKHTCSPYGIAYVIRVDCYKCHRETRVAILSSWYPSWENARNANAGFGFGDDCQKPPSLTHLSPHSLTHPGA